MNRVIFDEIAFDAFVFGGFLIRILTLTSDVQTGLGIISDIDTALNITSEFKGG